MSTNFLDSDIDEPIKPKKLQGKSKSNSCALTLWYVGDESFVRLINDELRLFIGRSKYASR